ncbi:MAG: hypothetical protein UY63_C0002G0020 [Parcubacteria group bacterium GW2011_GWA2_51_10]|nr:MAG: hypothetical protein UY63_C0002G0020 [Parcubacteria group bacterium GW2011_GWA2_51_10]
MAALLEGKKIRITFTAELYKHDVIEGVCKTVTALQPDSRGDPTRFALSFKIGNGLYVFDVSTQDGITADSIEGSYQPGGRYKIQVLN